MERLSWSRRPWIELSPTDEGPSVNGRVISRRWQMECSMWNRRRWMGFSVEEDFSERTVGMKRFSSAFTAIKFCVCHCEVVLLTKSMGNLTFSFSLSQSLVAMTLAGTVVTWLLRGHMWCVDSVGFLQRIPSDPLRGQMSKFLVRSIARHSHGFFEGVRGA